MTQLTSRTFRDILQSTKIKSLLPNENKWWSDYIYHFTDVSNAANILTSGCMYSRNHPNVRELMKNDNASNSVIAGTTGNYKDYVRFYFRPLTPTQYRNEGIRSRYEISDLDAHCPVPVFFLFDSNNILSRKDSYFSYESLASHYHVPIYQNIEDFEKAPFEYIYHSTPIYEGDDKTMIIKHRHAEVIIKDTYALNDLKAIFFRSLPDLLTLKSLVHPFIFEKYKPYLKISSKPSELYFNRHTNLKSVVLENSVVKVDWNNIRNTIFDLKVEFFALNNYKICWYYNDKFNPWQTQLRINMGNYLTHYKNFIVQITLDNNLIYRNIF